MDVRLTTIMISTRERDGSRDETLRRLWQSGLSPVTLIQTTPASKDGHRSQSVTALQAAQSDGHDLLFLEDDIGVSSGFRRALASARNSAFEVVTFYTAGMSFYPAALKRRILDGDLGEPFAMFEPTNRRGYFGSQSVLVKRQAIGRLLALMEWDGRQFDNLLPDAGRFGAVFPNPVQHLGRQSVTSARYHFHDSRSFCP